MPARIVPQRAPKILALSKQLERIDCDHLMGREVIEKQIVDLAMGAASASYCQNWDRCPTNDWGKCTPDPKEWVTQLSLKDPVLFSKEELAVIKGLKMKRM